MGLDVYVGSFTRYYAGDWKTVVQRYGREEGLKVEVVRPPACAPAPKPPALPGDAGAQGAYSRIPSPRGAGGLLRRRTTECPD